MKVLVVLVLAVVAGCQANLFYADEPKPQLEQLTGAFLDYVAKATHTAEDTLKTIRESQLGQEVNTRITEGANVASQYAVILQDKVSPLAQDIMTKITKDTEVLKERLEQDLTTVNDKIAERATLVLQGLGPYAEDLREKLHQYAQNLQDQLSSLYESFTKTN